MYDSYVVTLGWLEWHGLSNFCIYVADVVGFADVTRASIRRESGAYVTQMLRSKFTYIMQMLRAPAARGARNKGCYFWTPLYCYPKDNQNQCFCWNGFTKSWCIRLLLSLHNWTLYNAIYNIYMNIRVRVYWKYNCTHTVLIFTKSVLVKNEIRRLNFCNLFLMTSEYCVIIFVYKVSFSLECAVVSDVFYLWSCYIYFHYANKCHPTTV
jgi:hypothetical protein